MARIKLARLYLALNEVSICWEMCVIKTESHRLAPFVAHHGERLPSFKYLCHRTRTSETVKKKLEFIKHRLPIKWSIPHDRIKFFLISTHQIRDHLLWGLSESVVQYKTLSLGFAHRQDDGERIIVWGQSAICNPRHHQTQLGRKYFLSINGCDGWRLGLELDWTTEQQSRAE